jgi:succinyldiaminopimelate transaminase
MAFVPPPYPHDRLGDLRSVAEASPGGIVDASVGTPVDPTPAIALEAAAASLPQASGYPATIGSAALREAAAAWIRRRFDVAVAPDAVVACVGTKEVVAGLPRLLSLRDPGRDTVLYPALSYPSYAMGATLAGLRAVPVPVDDAWVPNVRAVSDEDASRALLLWCNDPSNPTGVVSTPSQLAATVAWARQHGIVVASDECYAEFTFDELGAAAPPVTALAGDHDGVLAVHSLSKRSNMAGFRIGFVAGDPDLVKYLGEVRKHAGMMSAAPMQAAAVAALGDDAHVAEQRARYAARRAAALPALERFGLVHDGGPSTFYLWLRSAAGQTSGWEVAARLAEAGVLVAPGDLYGPGGARHVRLALTLTDAQVEQMIEGLDRQEARVR